MFLDLASWKTGLMRSFRVFCNFMTLKNQDLDLVWQTCQQKAPHSHQTLLLAVAEIHPLEAAAVLFKSWLTKPLLPFWKIKIRTQLICSTEKKEGFGIAFSHHCTNSYKWKTLKLFELAKEDALDCCPAGKIDAGLQLGTSPDDLSNGVSSRLQQK